MSTTPARIHQMLRRLRKRSFEAEETIADCRLSNAAVESVQTMTRTMPTTQAGSCWRSRKKAMEPLSAIWSSGRAPDQAATRPVTPTMVRMQRMMTTAMETPTRRSLSVLEAKVRSQKPERKKSFVRMQMGRM